MSSQGVAYLLVPARLADNLTLRQLAVEKLAGVSLVTPACVAQRPGVNLRGEHMSWKQVSRKHYSSGTNNRYPYLASPSLGPAASFLQRSAATGSPPDRNPQKQLSHTIAEH